ncbi:hypothetical protein N431DRAFT_324876 [Stipitochalara longipes BDJ]|nr:hypothetical protein N431DRAFT_324876 [Stipitochalara longipes BDJ]
MRLPLLSLLPIAAATTILPTKEPQHIFSNPPEQTNFKIPTSYESAILARRVLNLTPLGTLSTIFPSSHHASSSEHTQEQRPAGIEGMPIGLMDYIADCEGTGDPTILAISIATSFKNVASGSNISLSLQWTPPYPPSSRISSKNTFAYSAANLPRFSLLGYLEPISEEEVQARDIGTCFVETHKDAKYWLPGNKIHASEWVRLVVREVYWIGGFGDRAYIGWIPIEEWRNVTSKEWEGVRLPGEKKGWKEWSLETFGAWEL